MLRISQSLGLVRDSKGKLKTVTRQGLVVSRITSLGLALSKDRLGESAISQEL